METSDIATNLIASLIAFVIGAIFKERIRTFFLNLIDRIQTARSTDIDGVWETHFSFRRRTKSSTLSDGATTLIEIEEGEEKHYTEIIELKSSYGRILGRLKPDPRNGERLAAVQHRRPIRIRGEIRCDRYFTGSWYHPIKTNLNHGAFQMIISCNGRCMRGKWVGFRDSDEIVTGIWEWKKLD